MGECWEEWRRGSEIEPPHRSFTDCLTALLNPFDSDSNSKSAARFRLSIADLWPDSGLSVTREESPTWRRSGSPTHDSQILLRHCFLLTSKVHLRRGSQHLPEHLNKSAHAVVTNCNSRLRYRFALGKHFKRSEQPCLLSPTAKRHTHLSGKRTHESAAGHTSKMRPVVQPAVVGDIIQQSTCNSGQPVVSGQGQTQSLLFRLRNLIAKNCDETLPCRAKWLP